MCTNGRHDVCCAERGRPLYRALAEEFPEQTWECSHIGGDRFAGNAVCFPHGVYFGWLEPQDAPGTIRRYAQGAIDLGAKLVAVGQVDGRGHGENDARDRGPGDRPDPTPEAHDPASRST